MEVVQQFEILKSSLPANVKLIAVSKTQLPEKILQIYATGHKIFGENKVQELINKHDILPDDIEWHMIGHLQSNKVKFIVPFISLIHSVDSVKLLETIDKEAEKYNRRIDCLIQVKIASEDTKYGMGISELKDLLNSNQYAQLKFIRLVGLMGMATFTNDNDAIRNEFKLCKSIFEEIKSIYFKNNTEFCEISMGMSDDYKIALDEGSTMIRIGSLIFGKRTYVS